MSYLGGKKDTDIYILLLMSIDTGPWSTQALTLASYWLKLDFKGGGPS